MVSEGGTPDPGLDEFDNSRPGPEMRVPMPPPGHAYMRSRMEEEGYAFEFFQAIRLLERLAPDRSPVGHYAPPTREVARFKVNQQLGFPASEIQRIEFLENGQAEVTVNFMGLTGPQGVLPLYYTEFIRERFRQRDPTTAGFFDLFNHRMISLFFQAWEKYRFPIAYERGDRDRFSHILLDLIGMGTAGLQRRMPIPDDSLIFYSGLLSSRHRPASGLANLIADYFDVPCDVQQFIGAWYPLSEESLCIFETADDISEQLGVGAIVGDEVYDQQSAVRLVIGPLTLRQYRDFLPDGSAHIPLRELARFYAGPSMDFEVQLILAMEEVPACHTTLGAEPYPVPGPYLDEVQLGWTTWVKTKPRTADAYEAVLRF
ncbi:MAG TPA: type VI secretion system baseplate subunit TssG [Bryobacteraceae bacterium]|nr:type VI secretion system baseplate subunit TssG [Bryobacteraceae bacterium]